MKPSHYVLLALAGVGIFLYMRSRQKEQTPEQPEFEIDESDVKEIPRAAYRGVRSVYGTISETIAEGLDSLRGTPDWEGAGGDFGGAGASDDF